MPKMAINTIGFFCRIAQLTFYAIPSSNTETISIKLGNIFRLCINTDILIKNNLVVAMPSQNDVLFIPKELRPLVSNKEGSHRPSCQILTTERWPFYIRPK